MSVPGVNVICAATFIAAIGDVHRSRRPPDDRSVRRNDSRGRTVRTYAPRDRCLLQLEVRAKCGCSRFRPRARAAERLGSRPVRDGRTPGRPDNRRDRFRLRCANGSVQPFHRLGELGERAHESHLRRVEFVDRHAARVEREPAWPSHCCPLAIEIPVTHMRVLLSRSSSVVRSGGPCSDRTREVGGGGRSC